MDWNEYVDHLRESRAFMRRTLAQRIIKTILSRGDTTDRPDMRWEADDLAKFAEDVAQALIVRLAAREEAEIAAGKMGGTFAATEPTNG